jgi:hypothetical protein
MVRWVIFYVSNYKLRVLTLQELTNIIKYDIIRKEVRSMLKLLVLAIVKLLVVVMFFPHEALRKAGRRGFFHDRQIIFSWQAFARTPR